MSLLQEACLCLRTPDGCHQTCGLFISARTARGLGETSFRHVGQAPREGNSTIIKVSWVAERRENLLCGGRGRSQCHLGHSRYCVRRKRKQALQWTRVLRDPGHCGKLPQGQYLHHLIRSGQCGTHFIRCGGSVGESPRLSN